MINHILKLKNLSKIVAVVPPPKPGSAPSLQKRLLIAVAIGAISFIISYLGLAMRGYLASDFTWVWRAAQVLLDGQNPYHNPEFARGNDYPFTNPLPYPLPAVLVVLPFAAFPFEPGWAYLAGALFFALSAALLAFGVTRDGFWRLPVFLSAPFFVAAYVAQWSPLILAGAFLPLLPVAVIKPNFGIPAALANFHWHRHAIGVVLILVSFLILPSWPTDWLGTLGEHWHPIPLLLVPPGPLLLLAALRWRAPAARLLLLLAAMPQTLFWYDQILLWLIPRTFRQTFVLSLSSWIGYIGWWWIDHQPGIQGMGASVGAAVPWIMTFLYVPALVLVLLPRHSRLAALFQRHEPPTSSLHCGEESTS